MNLQLLEAVALKMVNEAIVAAKTPEAQANAEEIVKKFISTITPFVAEDIKNGKINNFLPIIFGFCSGFFAGACVLLLILATKAGLL
jgi:hypothetical protein